MECLGCYKKKHFCVRGSEACKFSRHNTRGLEPNSESNAATDNESSDSDCEHPILITNFNSRGGKCKRLRLIKAYLQTKKRTTKRPVQFNSLSTLAKRTIT